MVRHIVIWSLLESFTPEQKARAAKTIKSELEALADKIDGVVEIKVIIDPMPTSNADVMLFSTFESEQALKSYIVHPEHKRVGSGIVKPNVQHRSCIDYEI